MQIKVHGKNNSVPKDIETFAVDKFEHLSRYLSTISDIDVELYEEGSSRKGGYTHVAHVTVATSGPVFRSKVASSDHRKCIDMAAERLERRLKEFKRRRSGKPAHSRPKVQSADNAAEASYEVDIED
ncbi:MAG: ribosome hibernation-promoting factor, HPF/YfiA family [Actinomycetota bacterium]|nr:ribosome-associated translation inhibitor RaiA [Actinomycetota bacterium]